MRPCYFRNIAPGPCVSRPRRPEALMPDPDVTDRIWTLADKLDPCMFVTCEGEGQRVRPVYARVRREEGAI